MKLAHYLILPVLLAGHAFAATWERPAGAYTPTNHSANITKYQVDSANKSPISSVKVDGDLNKAFQGLNDLDARTPPSVLGQAGKVLGNNGTSATWVTIPSDTLVSGTTTVKANPSSISLTVGGATSYFYSAGLVTSGVSASALSASTLSAGTVSATMMNMASGTVAGRPILTDASSLTNVRTTTKTDTFTSTSASWVDITGLSVAITPKVSSSLVLVTAYVTGAQTNGSGQGFLRLVRGSTAICVGDSAGSRIQASAQLVRGESAVAYGHTMVCADNPATNVSTTYKVQVYENAATAYINRSASDGNDAFSARSISTIAVQELN